MYTWGRKRGQPIYFRKYQNFTEFQLIWIIIYKDRRALLLLQDISCIQYSDRNIRKIVWKRKRIPIWNGNIISFFMAKMGLNQVHFNTFQGIWGYLTHTLIILCLKIIVFLIKINFFFRKMYKLFQNFGTCEATVCVLCQSFSSKNLNFSQ